MRSEYLERRVKTRMRRQRQIQEERDGGRGYESEKLMDEYGKAILKCCRRKSNKSRFK
jgi:hypothetical protein